MFNPCLGLGLIQNAWELGTGTSCKGQLANLIFQTGFVAIEGGGVSFLLQPSTY